MTRNKIEIDLTDKLAEDIIKDCQHFASMGAMGGVPIEHIVTKTLTIMAYLTAEMAREVTTIPKKEFLEAMGRAWDNYNSMAEKRASM